MHLAVRLFYLKHWRGKSLKIYSDNQATVNCLKRGYSSSEQMLLPLIIVHIYSNVESSESTHCALALRLVAAVPLVLDTYTSVTFKQHMYDERIIPIRQVVDDIRIFSIYIEEEENVLH